MEKVALVTGSSSGIGLETVLALARDGYETFASMRDVSKAVELEHAAKKENLKIKIIELIEMNLIMCLCKFNIC